MSDETTPKDDDAAAADVSATDASATADAAGTPDATDELLASAPAQDADNVKQAEKAAAKAAVEVEAAEDADTDLAEAVAGDDEANAKPVATKARKAKAASADGAAAATPEERAKAEAGAARTARTRGEADARPVRAVAKYLRFSAQKGRLVVDQIRGKVVYDAATVLMFSNRAAAKEILKVLKSAVANAENNHGLSADELYVSAAFVDEGPTFKRWKPRARGRVDKVNKRTCHITVVVSTAPESLLEGPRAHRKAVKAGRTSVTGSSSRSARVAASKAAPKAKSAGSKKKTEA